MKTSKTNYQMFKQSYNDPFNKEDIIVSNANVNYHFPRFFKLLFYHLLYFFALGPFTSIFLILFEKKNFLINLSFIPNNTWIFWF